MIDKEFILDNKSSMFPLQFSFYLTFIVKLIQNVWQSGKLLLIEGEHGGRGVISLIN